MTCLGIFDGKDRTTDAISKYSRMSEFVRRYITGISQYQRESTYANLLAFAVCACLHDSHQMCMLALLLRLGSPTCRAGNVDTILGHYGETRQSDLGLLLGLFSWFLGNSSGIGGRRSHAGAE